MQRCSRPSSKWLGNSCWSSDSSAPERASSHATGGSPRTTRDRRPKSITTGNPIAPATDPKELVARITDHINGNYAHLRTVRTILQTTSLDRSVTKREEVTNKLPNGSTIHFVRQPSSVRRERVLMSGEDLLREAMDEDGGIWSFHHGVFTQCLPKEKAAWLRSREQMPGMFPLDPRDIASTDVRWLFVDLLRGDRVLEVGQARTLDGQPRMALLMEHAFDPEHKSATAANSTRHGIIYRPGSSTFATRTGSASFSTSLTRRSFPGRPGS